MTQQDTSSSEEHVNKIYRIAQLSLGAASVVFLSILFTSIQQGIWQLYLTAAITAALPIAIIVAMRTIRAGKLDTGIWIILIGLWGVLPVGSLFINGLNIINGASVIVLTITYSAQMLDRDQARRANIYGFFIGIATALLSLMSFNFSLIIPQIQTIAPAMTILTAVTTIFLAIWYSREGIAQLWRSSIRNRLTIIVAATAIIPVLLVSLILGFSTYTQVKGALTQDTFDKLSAIENIKHTQLVSFFSEHETDMIALGETTAALRQEAIAKLDAINTLKKDEILRTFEGWDNDIRSAATSKVVEGISDLSIGFQEIGGTQVRNLYLGKAELENARDQSLYSAAHFEKHTFLTTYINSRGFEDVYLIDAAGNVIYSVQKGEAFGTNLISGPYRDSNLATLYQSLINEKAGQSSWADMALFDGEYAMFIGTPIFQNSTFAGVLAYQIPIAQIDSLVQKRTGLTASAETYLVGKVSDGIQLRSDRIIKEGAVGDPKIGLDADRALAGETDHEFKIGSTGDYEISSFTPLNIHGLNWAIITTGNVIEIFSPQVFGREKDYFGTHADTYNYYDIFLISSDGYIFYTSKKAADYQTNILTGKYSNTNLADLVRQMEKEKRYEFVDFELYAPSGDVPAAFFGIPLLNESNQNEIDLFVAAQVPVAEINAIMNEADGLGETGESYIIGEDFLGRMDSRFIADFGVETTVLNPDFAVNTEAVRAALAGETGQGTIIDYRGIPVLSTWKPIVIHDPDAEHPQGQLWAVLTEIDETEALQSVNQLATGLGLIISLAVLTLGGAAVFLGTRFATGFVTPIIDLTDTATQVAAGNLALRLATDSQDEIGTLTNTFNTMTAQLEETLGGLEERVAARTKDLATVADISTVTATISDPFQMLVNTVQLTQRGFNLYHAHVFTYDKESDILGIVACGYKKGEEHEGTHDTTTIPIGQEQSLVALAARTRKPVIVNDVQNEPGWLPNPLLPKTRAELAVPMVVGDELLGVLDVQSEYLDAFTEEDANIQMTLASQIATALQNTRRYYETQKRAELESLVNVIGQRIQRTTSIEDTLQTAIRELGTAIGAKRVKASIQSASTDTLSEPVASYSEQPQDNNQVIEPEDTPAE